MTTARQTVRAADTAALAVAAANTSRVAGLTHGYYRYPARFSPVFARSAITLFSQPGQLVLDPYMGGATTVVEAMSLGRRAAGNDLNSLAVFVARVKTTVLSPDECEGLAAWAGEHVPCLSYRMGRGVVEPQYDIAKMRNLTHVRARFVKKLIAGAMASLVTLPSAAAQDFARCAILKAGQLALDGRSQRTSAAEFRRMLQEAIAEMLAGMRELRTVCPRERCHTAHLFNLDAATLAQQPFFATRANRADLVVTSPPYPGVHVLYHRWQVDGRRETPAPYWIAGCNDGECASFYNFGDRRSRSMDPYFESSLRTLRGIRSVMADGAFMVQMVAFSDPATQLPRYLANMTSAGFAELGDSRRARRYNTSRIWRDVPNRKWHANLNGKTHSSREVVLVHGAI